LFGPEHAVAAQVVPAGWRAQPPAPSQRPFVPQVETAVVAQTSCGSSAPADTIWQVPGSLGRLQEVQAPAQAVVQQTPSAQMPLAHSRPVAHAAPFVLRLVHDPDWQLNPAAQSVLPVQVVRQASPEQT